MITTPKMYGLQCDHCGNDYEYAGMYSCTADFAELVEDATSNGWVEKGDEHYCEDCKNDIEK